VLRTDQPVAVIFDIQHSSLHDGPGIRTNVFFKGCPLRCKWCHNPESYLPKQQLYYNAKLCVGCMKCAQVCKYAVHSFKREGDGVVHVVENEKCTGCGSCIKVCCYDALSLVGTQYTVDELLEKLKVDFPYYSIGKSGKERGGITLTGGEPMQQFAFIDSLLGRTGDIHICMETSGYADPKHFEKLLPRVNLFLFDYKATDPEKHRQFCGVDNGLILSNLDLLYNGGADIILRLPLIPGVNDDAGHFEGVARLLEKYSRIDHAEIMAYHNLGVSKSENFGLKPPEVSQKSAAKEKKDEWLDRFKFLGLEKKIKIG
jgi:glycyl-radical enzyme activating protein